VIVLTFLGVVILGYLIGSIPVGFIFGKLARGIDIREHGSGNIGMTNVMRTIGVKAGIFVFFADMAKGAVGCCGASMAYFQFLSRNGCLGADGWRCIRRHRA
jgi:acyl-phosphate glycerol 3-phosphate acyltransferase